jgi:hypothetical protein
MAMSNLRFWSRRVTAKSPEPYLKGSREAGSAAVTSRDERESERVYECVNTRIRRDTFLSAREGPLAEQRKPAASIWRACRARKGPDHSQFIHGNDTFVAIRPAISQSPTTTTADRSP